jgi:hypothetical protein
VTVRLNGFVMKRSNVLALGVTRRRRFFLGRYLRSSLALHLIREESGLHRDAGSMPLRACRKKLDPVGADTAAFAIAPLTGLAIDMEQAVDHPASQGTVRRPRRQAFRRVQTPILSSSTDRRSSRRSGHSTPGSDRLPRQPNGCQGYADHRNGHGHRPGRSRTSLHAHTL